MKIKNRIFFIFLLSVSCAISVTAQNLKSMPAVQRDSLLISISKEVILKYGPEYYRENQKPTIIREIVSEGTQAGDFLYYVTFPYDKAEETLEWDYSARVVIRENTGNPASVLFGNGFGCSVPEEKDWRNDMTIEPIPYQEAIVALYPLVEILTPSPDESRMLDMMDYAEKMNASGKRIVVILPDSLLGKQEQIDELYQRLRLKSMEEPSNKEELLRKGYERQSDGNWVKTRPDVPPHKRVTEFQSQPAGR